MGIVYDVPLAFHLAIFEKLDYFEFLLKHVCMFHYSKHMHIFRPDYICLSELQICIRYEL